MDFKEYIFNTKKTYKFKIGVVGDVSSDFEENLENALKKYGLLDLSARRSTPILTRPLDFPNETHVSATYWDTELSYPTHAQALKAYLVEICHIPANKIVVRNENSPIEEYQCTKQEKSEYKTLLTNIELEYEQAQHLVGGERVMELLKELEKHKEKT